MNRDSIQNHYDVIIIGGGAGGLAAAAWLAKAGKKALLIEKEPRLGGLIAPLVHGPYRFDVGARLLMGCNTDGPLGPGPIPAFLQQIGVRQQVEFLPMHPIMDVRFPDSKFSIYSGRERFIDGLRQASPHGLERLPALLDLCSRLYGDSRRFAVSDKPWTPWRVLLEMPGMYRYATTTLEAVLSHYFTDRHARIVMGSLWPYVGIPPRQASFLTWANMIGGYTEEGAWYVRGGLGQLAEAIGRAFTQAGGEIRLDCSIRQVLVKDRCVTGVEVADGERYFAPAVIANIDPRLVFGPLMDEAEAPGTYRRRLAGMKASIPGVSIAFITDLDLAGLGLAFENLVFDSWNEDNVERTPLTGQVGFFSMNITTLADPGLAPPGQQLCSAFAAVPSTSLLELEEVQRYGKTIMDVVSQHIPGLQDHLLLTGNGVASGYLARSCSPIYGWEANRWQSSLGRPDMRTPVQGLLLAGHWTRPIHGVMSVIISGWEAARILLRGKHHE